MRDVSSPLERVMAAVREQLIVQANSERLRVLLWGADTACPMCGETLDRCRDHALTCTWWTIVFSASLHHGKISPARVGETGPTASPATEEGEPSLDLPDRDCRRPAGLWNPRGSSGFAEAFHLVSDHLFFGLPAGPGGPRPALQRI